MTTDEYFEKKKLLRKELSEKEKMLAIQYVVSNGVYKPGDIITDLMGSIMVEKFNVSYNSRGIPEAVYTGTILRKDLVPFKDGRKRSVWAGNIKSTILKK